LEVNSLKKNNLFHNHGNQDNQNLQTDSQSAQLAVIAGVITTFGDALATLSAVLAIEEAREEQIGNGDNKNMQKQIDYLTTEFEKLKKQVINQNTYYL
jgi:predicted transposase YdaD